jgi:hypothetical protein
VRVQNVQVRGAQLKRKIFESLSSRRVGWKAFAYSESQISNLTFEIPETTTPLQLFPFLEVAGRFLASLMKSVSSPACFSSIPGLIENT